MTKLSSLLNGKGPFLGPMSRLRRPHLPHRPLPLSPAVAAPSVEPQYDDLHRKKEVEERKADEELSLAIARLFAGRQPPSPAELDSAIYPFLSRLSHSDSLLRVLSLLPSTASAPLLFLSALRLRSPLADHRAAGKTVNLLLRSHDIRPAVEFLLSLPYPSPLLHDAPFNALIRALARAGHLRRALAIFSSMRIRSIPYSSFSFNSLIAALLRRGRTHFAARLFYLMLHLGVSPDAVTFNTLIRGFCLNSLLPEAFRVFGLMHRHRCDPDVVTYNTILDGLVRAGNISYARNMFDKMRSKSSKILPNVVTYTTLIRGCCSQLMVAEAISLLDEMVVLGLKPNKITFNTLMKGFCEARRWDLVKKILGGRVGFTPDTCTFNTLIAAYCNAGNVENAIKLLDHLSDLGVKADSATYSTLIRELCSLGNFEKAEVLADELLEKEVLRESFSCAPLVAAYNPLFEFLCRCGKTEKARKLLRELLDWKGTVDIAAFKTIILGYCREGKFLEGYKLLVSMVMRDLKPDFETYGGLLKGFLSKGKADLALESLKRMLDSGHRPSTDYFHSILKGLLEKDGYANEAGNLISVMLERKIRPNVDLSTNVISNLFRNGLNERAFGIVGLLYDKGYLLRMEKLVIILCKENKFLEARALLLFNLEKKEKLDPQIFCMVLNGLCAIERASEAFDLFYNVVDECGATGISSCMNSLKLALERAGRLGEAEFVSKQLSRVGQKIEVL